MFFKAFCSITVNGKLIQWEFKSWKMFLKAKFHFYQNVIIFVTLI
jgi:hypothetical protein